MAVVVHLYPTRRPPPRTMFVPGELMGTSRRHASFCYWNACHRARRGNTVALHCLSDIVVARPTERLASAAGGTLASLGHGYLIDGWGASA